MRAVLLLVLLGLAGYVGYNYFVMGVNPLDSLIAEGTNLPTRDAQGRELVPCQRCLATGRITCTAHRCKEGQVPCPGRCLKLTDSGWQRMEGQDPNKLFMIYRADGRTRGVSQAHVGEVFEVRLGKFYHLGICKICEKRTTVTCKSCEGAGKVACTVCAGQKTVVKPAPTASPRPVTSS
jgi:hypothetical protein